MLFSSQQIVLVVADNVNSSNARMSLYDGSNKIATDIEVNIGKNGLGWGLGEYTLFQDSHEPIKYEGDKKAPIGIFKLTGVFGYEENLKFKMPYIHATKNIICVDDSNSSFYNKIINITTDIPKSFEYMKRDDEQYRLGVVVEHNKNQLYKRGSCIFLHIEKREGAPTAGCTSMSFENMKKIVNWLDKSKNPILIQVPKSKLNQVYNLYPEIKN